jgi:hypothetical protein
VQPSAGRSTGGSCQPQHAQSCRQVAGDVDTGDATAATSHVRLSNATFYLLWALPTRCSPCGAALAGGGARDVLSGAQCCGSTRRHAACDVRRQQRTGALRHVKVCVDCLTGDIARPHLGRFPAEKKGHSGHFYASFSPRAGVAAAPQTKISLRIQESPTRL